MCRGRPSTSQSLLVLAALQLVAAATPVQSSKSHAGEVADGGNGMTNQFAVLAYLPEWRYEGANWDTICQHVSHLILFSLEVAPSGAL